MNKVILSGRVANTPEIRATKNGTSVATFVLAVERARQKGKDDEADWPTIIAWRQKAEFAAKYLTKGRKIIVIGAIRTRTYEDKDDKTRKVTEVYAEEIEFCDKKPQENNGTAGAAEPHADLAEDGGGDLPF